MIQLAIALFGLTAITFAMGSDPRLRKWAPLVGLAGQPAWAFFAYETGGWGLGVLVLAYTVVYLRAAMVQWRPVPAPLPVPVPADDAQRLYLAGPMTGLPDFNYPAFAREAALYRLAGFAVENPAENPVPPCRSWLGYMRTAIGQLARCDVVAMLPGWENSRGACVEHRLAMGLGLRVIYITRHAGAAS